MSFRHYLFKKSAVSTASALGVILWALSGLAEAKEIKCRDLNDNPYTVENKLITIINNSDTAIYPVINSSANEINEWRMACERVNQPTYTQKFEYRAYVNWPEGLAPGQSVTLTVPLYTLLNGATTDEQITWWNGGRLFMSDKKAGLESIYKEDSAHPIRVDDNLACVNDGSNCHLQIFANITTDAKGKQTTKGLPETIPGQLSEFTFGASIKPEGFATHDRRLLIPDNVNYNISYVDHTYLPVAIAPKSNPYIGYTGSIMPLTEFRKRMALFLKEEGLGWPIFNMEKEFPGVVKIPGGYNVFQLRKGIQHNGEPVLTPFGKSVQDMQNIWAACVPGEFSGLGDKAPACPKFMEKELNEIYDFFKENERRYTENYNSRFACATDDYPEPTYFDDLSILAHIYGWVPFNEVCGAGKNDLNSADPEALEKSSGKEQAAIIEAAKKLHHDLQMDYIKKLQYSFIDNPKGVLFNPYVKLIHDPKYLGMDAYAFSIDDAVGFMSELGTGLNFTVGGDAGLNAAKYQGGEFNGIKFTYSPKEPGGFVVSLGSPYNEKWKGPIEPLWASYGACVIPQGATDCVVKGVVNMPPALNSTTVFPPISAFRIGTIRYPVKVEFKDRDPKGVNTYSFVVDHDFTAPAKEKKTNPDNGIITQYYDIIKDCKVMDATGKVNAESTTIWCGVTAYTQEDPKQRGQRSFIGAPKPVKFIYQDIENANKQPVP